MTTLSGFPVVAAQARRDHAVAAFCWFLVVSLAAMPVTDRFLGRSTSLVGPGSLVILAALLSALMMRKRHPWIRLVLYIYAQVMIWLSLSCMAIAAVLFIGRS